MEYGSMSIQRLQSGRWLNWGIRFFLTAALTASQTAGGYAPFALGCIAAAGPGADGAAALLGGVTGALLFLDFQQVLALAAVGILILTAATAFRDTAFLQKPWVLPVLAAGMVLAVGGIYVLQSLDPLCRSIGPDRRFRPLLHPAVPAGGGPAGPGGAAVFRGGPDAGFRRPDHLECLRGPGPAVRPAGLHRL